MRFLGIWNCEIFSGKCYVTELLVILSPEAETSWSIGFQPERSPSGRSKEAEISQHGYIEDLVEEKARGIKVELKRCQPQMLTISEE